MKKFIIILFLFFLTGCISSYELSNPTKVNYEPTLDWNYPNWYIQDYYPGWYLQNNYSYLYLDYNRHHHKNPPKIYYHPRNSNYYKYSPNNRNIFPPSPRMNPRSTPKIYSPRSPSNSGQPQRYSAPIRK